MLSWIARFFRRNQRASAQLPPVRDSIQERQCAPAPEEQADAAAAEDAENAVCSVDYALLLSDSGSLEDLPEDDRYLAIARRHGGIIQPTVSGLTLILFETGADGESAAAGRLDFARELEKKSLARIRCLHGQTRAMQHAPHPQADAAGPRFTLRNFHVLVQHAAALDLGEVTEAGSYHASQRARARGRPARAETT